MYTLINCYNYNESASVHRYNLSLHLDIPSRLRAKQPLCSFFNVVSLGNMANYFVRSDRESNQRPNALELSTLTITTELEVLYISKLTYYHRNTES